MTSRTQRKQWRRLRGQGMTSAIGEYTPSEFWELLDEIDHLEKAHAELSNMAAPANWKLMPPEATKEMRLAANRAFGSDGSAYYSGKVDAFTVGYKAAFKLINAAPQDVAYTTPNEEAGVVSRSIPAVAATFAESYKNGYETAIETAAQCVEAQHCVWDNTDFPIEHMLQAIAKNIRALKDAPRPHSK